MAGNLWDNGGAVSSAAGAGSHTVVAGRRRGKRIDLGVVR